METTEAWIRRIFEGEGVKGYFRLDNGHHQEEHDKKSSYLMVPIKGNKIEVPVFALCHYIDLVVKYGLCDLPDYMALELKSKAKRSRFKSFDKIIKNVLSGEFYGNRLIRFEGKDNDRTIDYYGTNAALFDKDFNPLILCTWEFEKEVVGNSEDLKYCYCLVRPALRIDPHFYTEKYDNVGRFVCKKMMALLLNTPDIYVPYIPRTQSGIGYSHQLVRIPKVVIDEMPFKICKPGNPSIATTSQELRETALDNIEDLEWL